MNAGLIVIAILGGALLVLLIVGMAVLGWGLWRAMKSIEAHGIALAAHSAEMKVIIESARASFSSMRTEITRQQDVYLRETRTVLADHSAAMSAAIGKINAEALEAASTRGLQACIRIEKAATQMTNIANTLQKLLLTMDNESETPLGAEDYAPNDDTIYARVSDVARGDAEAQAEELDGAFTLG